jgi:hypothetical protein
MTQLPPLSFPDEEVLAQAKGNVAAMGMALLRYAESQGQSSGQASDFRR